MTQKNICTLAQRRGSSPESMTLANHRGPSDDHRDGARVDAAAAVPKRRVRPQPRDAPPPPRQQSLSPPQSPPSLPPQSPPSLPPPPQALIPPPSKPPLPQQRRWPARWQRRRRCRGGGPSRQRCGEARRARRCCHSINDGNGAARNGVVHISPPPPRGSLRVDQETSGSCGRAVLFRAC